MRLMNFNDIKKYIHEKYPGQFTDSDIENMPIIIMDEYNTTSSDVCDKCISISAVHEMSTSHKEMYNIPDINGNALFIEAF